MATASFNLSELNGSNGFVLNGIDAGDSSGASVSNAGDINGDGIDDLIIGARYADPNGNLRAGETYIVFGKSGGFDATLNLSQLNGSDGFVINGIDSYDSLGASVSGAGDINGDGIDDLIIGTGSFYSAGETYIVVFFGQGGDFDATLNLSQLDGSNGFVINSIGSFDSLGASVSGAGDINGDGIDDLIIGAPYADPNGNLRAGETYIVFGKSGGFDATLNLSQLNGSNGFVLNGTDSFDSSGGSVGGAGDINGDGIDDLIIGAPYADPNGIYGAGESYVVFGSSDGFNASFNLSQLDGSNGFVLNGIDENDFSGYSVSGAGDINGDGIDDLIIGADRADPNGNSGAGETYVVFGKSGGFDATLNLSQLDGSNGFILKGIDRSDGSGVSVSGAGDINGDGINDLIIGAPSADPNGNYGAGETYVVFGKSGGFDATLNLSQLNGSNGFVLNGINERDSSGRSVSGAGDINGDGIDDLIIGAPSADPNGNYGAGESYVVFGNANQPPKLDLNGSAAGIDFAAFFTVPGVAVPIVDLTNLTVNDPDSTTLEGAKVTITNLQDVGTEVLAADTGGTNITASYDPNSGTLILTGEATVANYQQVLRTLTYNNTASTPNPTDRIIEFSVSDKLARINSTTVATTTLTFLNIAPNLSFNLSQLNGNNGFVLNGMDSSSGYSVSGAGDINGDGIDDLIIGAPDADPNGKYSAGETYIVFGSSEGFDANLNLSQLDGSNGFILNGIDSFDRSGRSVSEAGDINGDGIDDLIIGAPFADPTGETYIVFGAQEG
ncbi:beta strand repeat-containing protein, partial [Coleofasciculus sp.]|uniref:beta strand repeat-containing protein n=1 Tax=Coleofasciculus sp. TaxID=3100458 RepID=UPI0039F7F134